MQHYSLINRDVVPVSQCGFNWYAYWQNCGFHLFRRTGTGFLATEKVCPQACLHSHNGKVEPQGPALKGTSQRTFTQTGVAIKQAADCLLVSVSGSPRRALGRQVKTPLAHTVSFSQTSRMSWTCFSCDRHWTSVQTWEWLHVQMRKRKAELICETNRQFLSDA